MPRYWVIAPVEAKDADLFDRIWSFDSTNNVISIGWSRLGDISHMSEESLADVIASKYPEKPPQTKSLYANMLWAFYHKISIDDVILARRGQKILAA